MSKFNTDTKIGDFKKISEEANKDENCLLKKNSKQMELNISERFFWTKNH